MVQNPTHVRMETKSNGIGRPTAYLPDMNPTRVCANGVEHQGVATSPAMCNTDN